MNFRFHLSGWTQPFFQRSSYLIVFKITRNFSRLRRLSFLFIHTKGHIRTKGQSSNKNEVISKTFLFMGNMSPYYFKTIFTVCMEGIPSFIKIGGADSEKNGNIGQTFVVLYTGYHLDRKTTFFTGQELVSTLTFRV